MRIRQYTYFAVASETMGADEMSARIGLQPDQTRLRGSRRTEPTVVPLRHSWMVCADQPGVRVDEQIRHVVNRVVLYRDAIAALVAELGSAGGARLQVVRYFNDASGDEEQLSGLATQMQKLPGQHQLLGWHLDQDVMAFLGSVGAEFDVDEYG